MMNEFSLMEKITMLMKLISSSPLFLILSVIGILFLIFSIIYIGLNKKINKWIFISIAILIIFLILISYGNIVFKIIDVIIDSIFMALYFPSLPIYVSVLIVSNICFIISMFNKKHSKVQKIINSSNSIILDFFLILIIDVVSKNNIDIYEEINLFTNSTLLILLELSMGIFISWILINLVVKAHLKLTKYDKEELPEIIFD